MTNRWDESEAAAAVQRWGDELMGERVYSSRLIGSDPALVLHGGGNTSVKGTLTDLFGDELPVLYVKGSGWSLDRIEPGGFPAVDLHRIRRLRELQALSDEQMVNALRTHLIDARAPNPSVETLLHAFLPHRFIDHSHADAILLLSNQPDGHRHLRAALGDQVPIVPYVMPGFALSKRAAEIYEAHPDCIGLVLDKHGLFTFGDTAKQSYDRHIELVERAEAYLRARPAQARTASVSVKVACQRAGQLAPVLRGALAEARQPTRGDCWRRWILDHRVSPDLLAALEAPGLEAWVTSGPLTPDHVIRTKAWPLLVSGAKEQPDAADIGAAVSRFRERYEAYFDAHRHDRALTRLDSTPRVIWAPGVGLFGVGQTPQAARIAADLGQQTLLGKHRASGLGAYEGLDPHHLFDMEYWSLEQAKLGNKTLPELAGQVALITGGAGAIGRGIAKELLAAGAAVVLADVDPAALERAASQLGAHGALHTVVMDVSDRSRVEAAFHAAACAFGGVDLVVPNAGVAVSGPLADLPEADWQRILSVNLTGVFHTVQVGAQLLMRQGTGGHIVIVSSKNVMAPGAEFSAYSASKAGAHQLGKVAAIELAAAGIAVNLVAPDAVFGEDPPSGLWQQIGSDRARAKGIAVDDLAAHYQRRNLLGRRITAADVGRAVRFFATNQTPTTGATLPVDGGVVGAFPR